MKIRILGNSLRLRLSQTEVRQLQQKGIVNESIRFSAAADNQLVYSLQKAEVPQLQARFANNQIIIELPPSMADDWGNSNTVGLSAAMPLEGEEQLKILVEKDFKCLSEREGEDEGDLFPNPEEELGC